MKSDFTLRFITLRVQVVKMFLFESQWFEAVKYTIALAEITKLICLRDLHKEDKVNKKRV